MCACACEYTSLSSRFAANSQSRESEVQAGTKAGTLDFDCICENMYASFFGWIDASVRERSEGEKDT